MNPSEVNFYRKPVGCFGRFEAEEVSQGTVSVQSVIRYVRCEEPDLCRCILIHFRRKCLILNHRRPQHSLR